MRQTVSFSPLLITCQTAKGMSRHSRLATCPHTALFASHAYTYTQTHRHTRTECSYNILTGGLWVEGCRLRSVSDSDCSNYPSFTLTSSLCAHTHTHYHTRLNAHHTLPSSSLSLSVTLYISQRPTYLSLQSTKTSTSAFFGILRMDRFLSHSLTFGSERLNLVSQNLSYQNKTI